MNRDSNDEAHDSSDRETPLMSGVPHELVGEFIDTVVQNPAKAIFDAVNENPSAEREELPAVLREYDIRDPDAEKK